MEDKILNVTYLSFTHQGVATSPFLLQPVTTPQAEGGPKKAMCSTPLGCYGISGSKVK